MARQADHPHVVAEVLAAELGADARRRRELPAPAASSSLSRMAWPSSLPRVGQAVEVAGAGQLHRLEVHLGARAADHDGQVVGRAGRGAEGLDLLADEGQQRLRVQQGLGLLEQEGLVGAAPSLGDDQEVVLVAVHADDVDLGRQVGARVDLLVGGDRRHLGVPQVRLGIGAEHAAGDGLLVATGVPSSEPWVQTCWPFLAMTIAVPVSWHDGSTMPADTFAFWSMVRATKRSLCVASDPRGSSPAGRGGRAGTGARRRGRPRR